MKTAAILALTLIAAFFVWAFGNIAHTAIRGNSNAPGVWAGATTDYPTK